MAMKRKKADESGVRFALWYRQDHGHHQHLVFGGGASPQIFGFAACENQENRQIVSPQIHQIYVDRYSNCSNQYWPL